MYENKWFESKFKDVRRPMMSRPIDEVLIFIEIPKNSYLLKSCLTSCTHECSRIIWYDFDT